MHTVTNLIASNQYVIVYCLDFSKAFDTVRHSTLMEKIAMLQLPDWVYNWMVDFFEIPQTSSSVQRRMVRIPGNSGKHHPGFRNWSCLLCCQRRIEIWRPRMRRTSWWSSQTTPTSSSHHLWKKQEWRRFPTSANGQRGITSLWTIPRPWK